MKQYSVSMTMTCGSVGSLFTSFRWRRRRAVLRVEVTPSPYHASQAPLTSGFVFHAERLLEKNEPLPLGERPIACWRYWRITTSSQVGQEPATASKQNRHGSSGDGGALIEGHRSIVVRGSIPRISD